MRLVAGKVVSWDAHLARASIIKVSVKLSLNNYGSVTDDVLLFISPSAESVNHLTNFLYYSLNVFKDEYSYYPNHLNQLISTNILSFFPNNPYTPNLGEGNNMGDWVYERFSDSDFLLTPSYSSTGN